MDVQDTPTHYQPAHELLKQLEAGTLTSEALITALLERIRDQNPAINAIVALDEHSALASAREADKQRALAGFLPRPHPRPPGTQSRPDLVEGGPMARNARVGLWLEDPLCPVEHELTGGYRTLGNSLADRGALVNLDIDPGRSKPRSSGNTGVGPDGRKRLP